jgi:hypothetical protein
MKTVNQERTANEQQKERTRPVEGSAVDFVGGRPERPEELHNLFFSAEPIDTLQASQGFQLTDQLV